jgi:Cu/Ag efflux protein CusF
MMVKVLSWLPAIILIAGLASCSSAPQQEKQKDSAATGPKPGAFVVDVVQWTGTVKAVDPKNKLVTVEGPGGKTTTVNAQNARNLDQVKPGDKVNVELIEEMALFVRKAEAAPSASEEQAVELAPKGKMPGGVVANTVQITANVEAIDYGKRTVDLKGPLGNVRTLKVDKSVKNFDQVKKGDQVVIRHTEAIAISVTKP